MEDCQREFRWRVGFLSHESPGFNGIYSTLPHKVVGVVLVEIIKNYLVSTCHTRPPEKTHKKSTAARRALYIFEAYSFLEGKEKKKKKKRIFFLIQKNQK